MYAYTVIDRPVQSQPVYIHVHEKLAVAELDRFLITYSFESACIIPNTLRNGFQSEQLRQ